MPDVFANSRSICHAGSGNVHTCAIPDVCKTPSPGGPIPIPYPNIAKDGDLSQGSKKTKIGGNPIALESSKLSTSSGDEAGTAGGGLMSSKTKGAMTWGSVSLDVKVEGKGVARLADVTQHNGNTFNSAFVSAGTTGLAYGDDVPCPLCKKKDGHPILETKAMAATAQEILSELSRKLQDQRPKIERMRDKIRRMDVRLNNAKIEARKIPKRVDRDRRLQEINAQFKVERQELRMTLRDPVLRMEETGADQGLYVQGYMVGALVCDCGSVKVAACSGEATKGFKDVVKGKGFTLKRHFNPTPAQTATATFKARTAKGGAWQCAAPKLLEGSGKHRPQTMTEQWYSPIQGRPVKIPHVRDGVRVSKDEPAASISSGQSAPSCETCQELLPFVVCKKQEPCPEA